MTGNHLKEWVNGLVRSPHHAGSMESGKILPTDLERTRASCAVVLPLPCQLLQSLPVFGAHLEYTRHLIGTSSFR